MTQAEYKAAFELRLAQFKRLNEWEEANPCRPSPEVALAAMADIYERLAPELRSRPLNEAGYLAQRRNLEIIDRALR